MQIVSRSGGTLELSRRGDTGSVLSNWLMTLSNDSAWKGDRPGRAILYHLLTARSPFQAESFDAFKRFGLEGRSGCQQMVENRAQSIHVAVPAHLAALRTRLLRRHEIRRAEHLAG